VNTQNLTVELLTASSSAISATSPLGPELAGTRRVEGRERACASWRPPGSLLEEADAETAGLERVAEHEEPFTRVFVGASRNRDLYDEFAAAVADEP
jgi:hypothetical protein